LYTILAGYFFPRIFGGFMKKIGFILAIALLAAGAASAQMWGASQLITVNGTLQLQNGFIAVAEGATVYFVPVLNQYIGFIDGLKEGSLVSVEGYASGNYLQPSKVIINGKSYDFQADLRRGMGRGRYGSMQGRGNGYCGGWCW
jgi:hypothetical protein